MTFPSSTAGSAGAALRFNVVIPARLGSTRLPRKVLRPLAGKPLIEHVWRAAGASGAHQVVIATDAEEVVEVARAFGADVAMTSEHHASGTDRANEVAMARGWSADDIVVNLQGDEPLMPPALLRQVAYLLAEDEKADIATLAHPLFNPADWKNPNVVKLVCDLQGYALYFSRAPIPWPRGASDDHPPSGLALHHVGLYAYRVGALRHFASLPPSALEVCESLEQLRALSNGLRIRVGTIEGRPPRGVDTESDLSIVDEMLRQASA